MNGHINTIVRNSAAIMKAVMETGQGPTNLRVPLFLITWNAVCSRFVWKSMFSALRAVRIFQWTQLLCWFCRRPRLQDWFLEIKVEGTVGRPLTRLAARQAWQHTPADSLFVNKSCWTGRWKSIETWKEISHCFGETLLKYSSRTHNFIHNGTDLHTLCTVDA